MKNAPKISTVAAVFLVLSFAVPGLSRGGFFVVPPASAADVRVDSDGDGLSDADETSVYFTDPINPDTDGDGYPDGLEVANGYSPRHDGGRRLMAVDSDSDYLVDGFEIAAGTSLLNPDSDGDLYLDGTEVAASFDPLDPAPKKLAKVIKVDLAKQSLSYFMGDRQFGSFLISSGLKSTPTPRGTFSVLDKVPVKHYGGNGFDYPNTKWNLHFTTVKYRYYIHGAYWHDDFGRPKSHGCVNVSYADMEPLYWWAQVGTRVEIN